MSPICRDCRYFSWDTGDEWGNGGTPQMCRKGDREPSTDELITTCRKMRRPGKLCGPTGALFEVKISEPIPRFDKIAFSITVPGTVLLIGFLLWMGFSQ